MKELVGKQAVIIFNLPSSEWPIEGCPAWVNIDAVDMPMIKITAYGRSVWINANIIKTITEIHA